MKIVDGKRVYYSEEDIRKFNAVWPCSPIIPMEGYFFEFDWRGDLVDSSIPEHMDGDAASALADDARAFITTTGALKPGWMI